MRPPSAVLEAFGVRGEPRLLDGGQGRTWRAGDVVLKPVDHAVEHSWVCDVYDDWSSPDVDVPRPLRTRLGDWSAAGWGAHRWTPGATAHAGDDPDWFRAAVEAFHS
ncbi:MAG: TIGR02569 family protein, partial [Nocardioides sp.]